MKSQMERHDEAHHPHGAALTSGGDAGEQQQQHEHGKKSVLKKVKAKAKKLKDSLTAHSHHHHEHDVEDDEDEEMEEDAELHGAPMYDTTEARRPYVPGHGGASIQHDVITGAGPLTSATAAPLQVADHRHGSAYSTNPSLGIAAPVVADHPHGSAYSFGTSAPEIGDYRSFEPEQVGILKQDGLKFGGGQTHQAAAAPATGHTVGHAGVQQRGVLTHHEHTAGVQTGIGSRPAEPVAHLSGSGVRDSSMGMGVNHQHGILTHQGHIQGTPHLSVTGAQTQTILGVEPAEPATHGGVHDSGLRAGVQQHGVLTHQGQIHDLPRFQTQAQTGLGTKPAAPADHSIGHAGVGARQAEPAAVHSVGYGDVHESGLAKGDRRAQISTQEGPILDRPVNLETDPSSPVGSREPENYQSKVTDPTGMGGEEIGVTHILHSLDRLNHHDQPDQYKSKEHEDQNYTGTRSHVQFRPNAVSDRTYAEKAAQAKDVMASKLDDQKSTPSLTEKAVQAKDVIASKLGYGDDEQKSTPSVAEKAAQAKDVMASKHGYGGDEQKSTTSSITEKAVQAKDVIASKLGYGGDNEQKSTSSVTDYGKKMGSTVQATLAPVYDKVAGAGGAVMSKFQGSPDTPRPTQGSSDFDDDKGVSVKEYVTEKLSPGEDAKALSEVISGALTSGEDKEERKAEPKGRVTFSAKVERQLGISNQDEHELDYNEEDGGGSSPGRAMVDRLKGAMTSWWGKGGENEPSAVAFYDTPKEGFSETKPQEQGKPRLQ